MTNHVLNHENKALQSILGKVQELQHYNSLLEKYLDPEVAKNCKVVRFDKNCLFVLVENGNWATQLRFQVPDLMSKLRKYPELSNLSGVICKTRPSPTLLSSYKTQSRTVSFLSHQTADSILKTAKTLTDIRLRKILEKIAGYLD